jgi:dihydrofolate reductase
MRKIKLQMNFDGIDWDEEMVSFCINNLKDVDAILLGRKTAEGFIPYWGDYAHNPKPKDINSRLGKPLTDIHKIVFSNELKTSPWENATIISGDMVKKIKSLKKKTGKDMIVFGGLSFASSLVKNKLVDDYYFFVNPLAVNSKEPVLQFINSDVSLKLKDCKAFPSGTVLLHYANK